MPTKPKPKAGQFIGKASQFSHEAVDYAKENPLVVVGLTLAAGTMAVAMGGGKRRWFRRW
ncbi:MAG: hypothetical protein E4H48_10100 [Syntrophobacterales bacterium]|jgi:hypothetical protein|nr:MAG: hypothetical protein E4H48_10100 [Syntrophobacterales bacterium]